MSALIAMHQRITGMVSGALVKSVALFINRVALAGIFWRSYLTKVEEGTWLTISEVQYFIFENEFAGLPVPSQVAVPVATYSEFAFPILLVIGLASRVSAAALLIMALVIQIFVFPTMAHFLGWAITVFALSGIIISCGPGLFSLDALIVRITGARAA